ncbi:MAG: carboxypeptidase [Oligoflexia bacterium]|nr:carboxypeptidase [Oligoflexia bacterium]
MKGIIFSIAGTFLFSFSVQAQQFGGYAEIKNFLSLTQARFPATTRIVDVGPSDSGDRIYALAIGNGPLRNLVVATHHGNEYGSTGVAAFFAAHLASQPIAGQTVYVIPVLNIWGYNGRSRYEMGAKGYHDPNRDYPGPCGTEGPFDLKSTASLAKFIADQSIVTSATLHTFWPVVVYPWGISTHDTATPYDNFFIKMAQFATQVSGYKYGNNTELIYPADGTFEDYAFWKHGIWSMLFELGSGHSPTQSSIEEMARVNVPGLRSMLENSPPRRAADHEFRGRCDTQMRSLDLHIE